MIRKEIEILNKLGLHARAAAKLVQCAGRFASHVEIERRGQSVNGKSIMGVMMLAASQGTRITVEASGEDEDAAMAAIEALIGERFGESE
ncbi:MULTISPECIES: HPr family phosphocarrier protein [Thiocapsa]|jgi:phosphocarrier protein|uniref:Phosphotransferase system, phosphocarrier protein HPr n=1 Tax=Thiocapsa marina 5811 TaxID=768671 RepID=F9U8Z9_9GAMM|nr:MULTISPECIES: HPr family phosphocarrier protein [Thiocapsa]EGV19257.1 Phosphotransferase system, phosphocarrier protein HPr [Thiocapsa marina 5811]UHD14425.1 HPr family phosphocarrier protein [Thiocapsa bogorovii]